MWIFPGLLCSLDSLYKKDFITVSTPWLLNSNLPSKSECQTHRSEHELNIPIDSFEYNMVYSTSEFSNLAWGPPLIHSETRNKAASMMLFTLHSLIYTSVRSYWLNLLNVSRLHSILTISSATTYYTWAGLSASTPSRLSSHHSILFSSQKQMTSFAQKPLGFCIFLWRQTSYYGPRGPTCSHPRLLSRFILSHAVPALRAQPYVGPLYIVHTLCAPSYLCTHVPTFGIYPLLLCL